MRLALRSLAKSPGFTVVAVLTLALGLGATTAIYSVVHAVILSPLAYRDADRLVQVQSAHPEQGTSGLAPATFYDVAAQSDTFSALAAQTYYYVNLTKSGPPALATAAQATGDYFRVFGVSAFQGRTWTPAEAAPGATPVVVLGEALWRRHYAADPALVGRTIVVNDVPTTVLGIMPASFKDPWGNAELWMPMPLDTATRQDRATRYWSTFGRLRDGVTVAQATAALAPLAAQLAQNFPATHRGWTLQAAGLHRLVVGDVRPGLLLLLGAVGCVLLITCANVAGLTLVRATARRKELAVRAALGASRARLVRQLLAENLLLALLGGLAGLLVGSWGLDALLATLPSAWLPRADEIALDRSVLFAALVLTLVTGLASGLLPALAAARADPQDALKDHARGSAGPAARRLRSGLVVAEIALALVLLVGAGLLARNLLQILARPAGLDAPRLLALTVLPSEKRYDSPEKRAPFFARALAAVAAVPGVEAAAFTQTTPFRWGNTLPLAPVPAAGEPAASAPPPAFYDSVSTDYFKTVGAPLRAGRVFNDADIPGAPQVVILSESTARRFFGAADPIGREITSTGPNPMHFTVVGVVGDILRAGLASTVRLQVYRPLAQRTPAFATLMVRTALPPASLAKPVSAALWQIDPDVPVSDVAPVEQLVRASAAEPRLYLTLFGLFAALALLLATVGLYGVIAYSVAQRTREFGIRTALGASPRAVLALVLREGSALIALGLLLGLAGAAASAHLLSRLLFSLSAYDPFVFALVPLVLAVTTLLAALLPARRATRVDPILALRSE